MEYWKLEVKKEFSLFLQGIEYGCNIIPYRTGRIGNGELI